MAAWRYRREGFVAWRNRFDGVNEGGLSVRRQVLEMLGAVMMVCEARLHVAVLATCRRCRLGTGGGFVIPNTSGASNTGDVTSLYNVHEQNAPQSPIVKNH